MTGPNRYVYDIRRTPGGSRWQVVQGNQAERGGIVAGTEQIMVDAIPARYLAVATAQALGHAYWQGRCQGGVDL